MDLLELKGCVASSSSIIPTQGLHSNNSLSKGLNPVKLRGTQTSNKIEVLKYIEEGYNRILFIAPCAYGKTIMITSLICDFLAQNKTILIVLPYTSLIEQTIKTFRRYGIEAGVIAGGYPEDRTKQVQIAMRQTLERGRDISWFDADYWIFDETHEISFTQWALKEFPYLDKETGKIATPKTLKKELELFDLQIPCTLKDARTKHRRLIKQWHPDVVAEDKKDQAIAKSVEINKAWEKIKRHENLLSGEEVEKDRRVLIGFTATPFRLKKSEEMGDIFEVQVKGPTPREMIDQELLVPLVCYSVPPINTKGVRTTSKGEYVQDELEVRCSDVNIIKSAVDNYLKYGEEKVAIAFTPGIKSAKLLVNELEGRGIRSAIVVSDTPHSTRKIIYRRLAEGRIKVLVSVDCLTAGFDVPEIECIIDCAPTKSLTKWVQRIGRGMRLAPWIDKKYCVVIDQAGNMLPSRHGMIEFLEYPDLRKSSVNKKGKGNTPIRVCESCNVYNLASAKVCKHCGTPFPVKEKKEKEGNKLQELIRVSQQRRQKKEAQPRKVTRKEAFYKEKLRVAFKKNYPPSWAIKEFQVHYYNHKIKDPNPEWSVGAIYGDTPSVDNFLSYRNYLINVSRTDDPKIIDPCLRIEFKEDFIDYVHQVIQNGNVPVVIEVLGDVSEQN